MSAIDFRTSVRRKPDPKGDRVVSAAIGGNRNRIRSGTLLTCCLAFSSRVSTNPFPPLALPVPPCVLSHPLFPRHTAAPLSSTPLTRRRIFTSHVRPLIVTALRATPKTYRPRSLRRYSTLLSPSCRRLSCLASSCHTVLSTRSASKRKGSQGLEKKFKMQIKSAERKRYELLSVRTSNQSGQTIRALGLSDCDRIGSVENKIPHRLK